MSLFGWLHHRLSAYPPANSTLFPDVEWKAGVLLCFVTAARIFFAVEVLVAGGAKPHLILTFDDARPATGVRKEEEGKDSFVKGCNLGRKWGTVT